PEAADFSWFLARCQEVAHFLGGIRLCRRSQPQVTAPRDQQGGEGVQLLLDRHRWLLHCIQQRVPGVHGLQDADAAVALLDVPGQDFQVRAGNLPEKEALQYMFVGTGKIAWHEQDLGAFRETSHKSTAARAKPNKKWERQSKRPVNSWRNRHSTRD